MTDFDLCIRDVVPEIVQRGYRVLIQFGHVDHSPPGVYLLSAESAVIRSWAITDPPSIARALCEALVRTEGQP